MVKRKRCSSCAGLYPMTMFHHHAVCSECTLRAAESRFLGYLDDHQQNYCGIGLTKFLEILESQRGKCKICDIPSFRVHAVDVCPLSGEVRGILCTGCKKALDIFADNVPHMQKAVDHFNGGGIRPTKVIGQVMAHYDWVLPDSFDWTSHGLHCAVCDTEENLNIHHKYVLRDGADRLPLPITFCRDHDKAVGIWKNNAHSVMESAINYLVDTNA